jgi:hypothetical protein
MIRNSSAKVQWQQASIPRDDQSGQHTHFRNDLFSEKKEKWEANPFPSEIGSFCAGRPVTPKPWRRRKFA